MTSEAPAGWLVVQERRRLYREALSAVLADATGMPALTPVASDTDLRDTCEAHRMAGIVMEADDTSWDTAALAEDLHRRHPGARLIGLCHGRRRAPDGLQRATYRLPIAELARMLVPDASVADDYLLNVTPAQGAGDLSERELRVLAMISSGLTAREAATRLGITLRAAERAKQRSYAKLGVQSQAQAVSVAVRQGLLAGAPE